MPSRQDQLQSYQFSVQRVVAALVTHDSDPAQSPFRRTVAATVAGVVLAALGVAGMVAYAAAFGATTDKTSTTGTVYVEKRTGAKYVYLADDKRLHPVLNYASAALLSDRAEPPASQQISAKSLANATLGRRLGIPGAPDLLPGRDDLLRGAWTLCSRPGPAGGDPTSLLVAGGTPTGGRPLPASDTGPDPVGLLVATPDGTEYLLHDNYRHWIPDPQTALPAINLSGSQPVQVAAALVNALPAGQDLKPLATGAPGPSKAVHGAKIGQVYTTTTGTSPQYAVVLADGVLDIHPLQANLLLAQQAGSQPVQVSIGEFSHLPHSPSRSTDHDPGALPATNPVLVNDDNGSVCVRTSGAGGTGTVLVGASAPAAGDAVATPRTSQAGTVLADQVSVAPGHGVLVGAAASPGAPAAEDALSLVTDAGMRYPIDRAVLGRLGYSGVPVVRMPASLVAMIPSGPALDPTAARSPA